MVSAMERAKFLQVSTDGNLQLEQLAPAGRLVTCRRALVGAALLTATSCAGIFSTCFAPKRLRQGVHDLNMLESAQLVSSIRDTDVPMRMTFYMYRAQSDETYPLENVNAADLAGVMWYLHNEIMGVRSERNPLGNPPRKYDVTRILRYKVTVLSTQGTMDKYGRQFGQYVAFDKGKCTTHHCANLFATEGFNVGCQLMDPALVSYASPFVTRKGCSPGKDCPAVWYSLPGQCPSQHIENKNQKCAMAEPGGACRSPTGSETCTFHYEAAGEIRLEELSGFDDSTMWWQHGNREYDTEKDKGVGTTFWDGINNQTKCASRMNKVYELFKAKYPDAPAAYGEPPCDFS